MPRAGGLGGFLSRWRDRRLARGAAAVLAINNYELDLLRSAGLPEAIVMPLGAITSDNGGQVVGERNERNGRTVVALAPLHPINGFVPFLKAMAEVGAAGDGWDVVLAGPEVGDWRRQLEAAVVRKGGQDRVRFESAGNLAAQVRWLERGSVLVAPSLHPQCPTSVLLGLAAGIPILATACMALPSADSAIRVCEPNREAMRTALRTLLSMSDGERSRLVEDIRRAATTKLAWSVVAPCYADLYTRLVAGR